MGPFLFFRDFRYGVVKQCVWSKKGGVAWSKNEFN